jgi:hypothetical protein
MDKQIPAVVGDGMSRSTHGVSESAMRLNMSFLTSSAFFASGRV